RRPARACLAQSTPHTAWMSRHLRELDVTDTGHGSALLVDAKAVDPGIVCLPREAAYGLDPANHAAICLPGVGDRHVAVGYPSVRARVSGGPGASGIGFHPVEPRNAPSEPAQPERQREPRPLLRRPSAIQPHRVTTSIPAGDVSPSRGIVPDP